ncbi:hypothetical protein ADIWIN_1600 [Winogradskyella psychrotolerans RS-3]|uniref:Uncharacterized protein n=1 Tax=Winogradskyella psychrotolerans RS-3 TaxID=641526 RepID=S7VTJ2_9FLAO|nr:hypothetical protein [Winogradskyella psychrotolerans]EPR73570.1 hypothetical protein ADIWIN_1600 [Winogradskyella psychrotolerans RS-3]
MKTITKKKTLLLISIGIFVVAMSQIFSQLTELPDIATGSFIGIGIGLLLTGLIFGNFKTVK